MTWLWTLCNFSIGRIRFWEATLTFHSYEETGKANIKVHCTAQPVSDYLAPAFTPKRGLLSLSDFLDEQFYVDYMIKVIREHLRFVLVDFIGDPRIILVVQW